MGLEIASLSINGGPFAKLHAMFDRAASISHLFLDEVIHGVLISLRFVSESLL